jgi:hypothetical protein
MNEMSTKTAIANRILVLAKSASIRRAGVRFSCVGAIKYRAAPQRIGGLLAEKPKFLAGHHKNPL